VGRPAINTALTDPFNLLNTVYDAGITEDQAKNMYNSSDSSAAWTAAAGGFVPWIAQNLPIMDALDGVCGNQAFALQPDAGAKAYGTLATVLADDELYVDTTVDVETTGTCSYLGAELEAVGDAPPMSNCGGRQPTEDVIDITYNLLACGIPCLSSGAGGGFQILGGGGTAKAASSNPPNDTTPPYLGAPN